MAEQRRRTRINSKIAQLPDCIQDCIDEMLLDTGNTYDDIAIWLKEEGYEVSRAAVGRYAIRANQATQRVTENLEKMKAIVKIVEDNPNVDYTKANRILMMDGLMNRVATAEEEFNEMPLDKAGRLIASLSRVQIYEDKIRRDYKTKVELAFEGMEAELMNVIKSDKVLAGALKDVLAKAKEKMISDD